MRLLSEQDRAARAELRAARQELGQIAASELAEAKDAGHRWWQALPETDDYLAANARVAQAEEPLPWWKRVDLDHDLYRAGLDTDEDCDAA